MTAKPATPERKAPAKKPTRELLIKTHNKFLKAQELTPDTARQIKQPVMAEAYPPCTQSIHDLEIIPLSQLQPGLHHRGQALILRAVTAPYVSAGAISIVEDATGTVDKLAIYHQPDSSVLSALPEGCVAAVKEPFYKRDGQEDDYVICVDHPSDVLFLSFTDSLIPEELRLKPLLQTAEEWRTAGDRAFIEKDFPTAILCYSEALSAADDESIRSGILSKRAGVNLMLNRHDAALADALAARTGSLSDWRALFTAGRAAYALGAYSASQGHLEAAMALQPTTQSALQREYERCRARRQEEDTGVYDFPRLHASLDLNNIYLDAASFLQNTTVADSTIHGRGLFATRNIPAGEIVLVEKAALLPNQYEPTRASASLYAALLHATADSPTRAQQAFSLSAGIDFPYPRSGREGALVDGVPVVDVFLLESIRTSNCFSAPPSTVLAMRHGSTSSNNQAKGLWIRASAANHSCVPNSVRSFLGDLLVSRATREIRAGQEIVHQYVPVQALPDARAAQYAQGWGFACECALCAGEKGVGAAVLNRRRQLLGMLERTAAKKVPGQGRIVPDATIRVVERLARQLGETYEAEVYAGLPRLGLVFAEMWLLEAHRGRRNQGKVLRHARNVVRNFGFCVVEAAEEWEPMDVYEKASVASLMTLQVVTALRYAAEAYTALGKTQMAERCTEAARLGLRILTGFDNDLSILDG